MKMKKHLSWLLSAAMMITTFSVPVFAADSSTAEAKVGDTYYDSLLEAVSKANGEEVTMLKDVDLGDVSEVESQYEIQQPSVLKLDLGQHKLTAKNT